VAASLIQLAGMPMLRSGLIFQLPGITIQVAQECSGIRSSLVLFIVSILAGHMLLAHPGRKLALALFVIPLGIFRNGFRILTIAWLCVHVDSRMVDSPIHHRGGPIFFALSLIPLFLFLLWLRRSERPQTVSGESLPKAGDANPSSAK
jgi:exosortase/archaeosortase family protein